MLGVNLRLSDTTVRDVLRWAKRGYDDWRSRGYLRPISCGIRPEIIDTLSLIYNRSCMLSIGSHTYPVTVYSASEAQAEDIDSVLDQRSTDHILDGFAKSSEDLAKTYAFGKEFYRKLLMARSPSVFNGRTYAMRTMQVSIDQKISILCSGGDYYSTLDTCAALDCELRIAATTGSISRADPMKSLPLRRAAHDAVAGNVLRNGIGRCASIGISTLIVYKDERGDYHAMFQKRSQGGTILYGGMYHTIPAMMFQSVTPAVQREFSVSHNIHREYLEELFSCKQNAADPLLAFRDHEQVLLLQSMLSSGDAQMFFTGVAINLLDLRPEICAVLVFHDPSWYGQMCRNKHVCTDEYDPTSGISEMPISALIAGSGFDVLNPEWTVPPGAAAIYLGVRMLRAKCGLG